VRQHEKIASKANLMLQMAVLWTHPNLPLIVLTGEAVQLMVASKHDPLGGWKQLLVLLLEEQLAKYRLS
jgi:hypothetical protein